MKQKICLGTDHAGYELKEHVKSYLQSHGYEVKDFGAHSYDKEDDYPDFIIPCAQEVAKSKCFGIIFGGSGQGEAISANKVSGVRAAVYYGFNLELVKLSKLHNNSNILSIGGRFVSNEEAIEAVKLWLSTKFQDEERHVRRIEKISEFEK
jgi:ribose 5-phosphate isomerase B